MRLTTLLSQLRQSGIELRREGEQLRVKGPAEHLTLELKTQLKARKEEILAFLAQAHSMSATPRGVIPLASRDAPLPLSFAQQRLWFIHEHIKGQEDAYNMPQALRLKGPLSLPALRDAFDRLVARHDILRTTFAIPQESDAAQPVQVIAAAQAFELPVIGCMESDVARHAADHAQQVFDLRSGPLLKATILQLGEQDHVLLINMHHIISDGWSLGVMTQDLQQFYEIRLADGLAELPALPIQYADYAYWQRQQDLDAHLAYWTSALSGYEEGWSLPHDRLPDPGGHGVAGIVHHAYPAELAQQVALYGQGQRATLFMMLLASMLVVLHRYTGRTDLCIGTTVAGRDMPELEQLIGFFINILPLRVDLSGNPDAEMLLRRVKEAALQGFEHQALPFEQLLASLPSQRKPDAGALVAVMLRHQNFPEAQLSAWSEEVEVAELQEGEQSAKCELDLQFYGDGGSLEVMAEYDAGIFDASTIERLLQHHQQVLEQWMAEPDIRLDRFTLLTYTEQRQLIQWNQTAQTFDQTLSVPQLFERQVKTTPQAIAAYDVQGSIDYAQLNSRANRIAHALQAQGVHAEMRVALYVERSIDFLAGLLGIFKANAIYVPLDPQYPTAYLQLILRDAQPRLVLVHSNFMPGFADDIPVLRLDDDLLDTQPDNDPLCTLTPGHLAYIAYTSGSTGQPKGVMIPHRQILNWLQALWKRMPFEPDDVVAQRTSAAFVVSMKELLAGLLAGCPLVLIPDSVVKDTSAFIDTLHRHRITRLNIVPSHLQSLLAALGNDVETLRSLRYCVTAGEPLTQALRKDVHEKLPWVRLWNNYGCTELNDVSYCLPDELSSEGVFVSIGRPIANTRTYVLNAELRQVPFGVMGELCVESAGMAHGYWNQPDLTAERFVPHPFAGEPGARLYRTGDMVRQRADGTIEYLGRKDFEIKIRGHRIDVRQVEKILKEYPGIDQAVVTGWAATKKDPQLVAYYAAAEAHNPNALRTYLAERLPGFMVPTLYVSMDAMPKLPNGKLDRLGLPAPDMSMLQLHEYTAPRTATEIAVAEIWSELLNVPFEKISIYDNFFILGGHSLLGAQAVASQRRRFNIDMPVRTLFDAPTISELASVIEQSRPARHASIPILPAADSYPLSHAQSRIWVFQQLNPDSSAYHLPGVIELPQEVSSPLMQKVLATLAERHASLRTVFIPVGHQPAQVIHARLEFELSEIAVESEETLERLTQDHAQRPFNLELGPLFRALIVCTWDNRRLLLWNMHHIISDGMSFEIIQREALALIDACLSGEPNPLPPLTVRYVDFAAWQNNALANDLNGSKTFWHEQLAGELPMPGLPYDYPSHTHTHAQGAAYRFLIPRSVTAQLTRIAHEQNATLFMVLFSGFLTLLARLTGQKDLIIATAIAGREHPDTQHLIGCFINTVMLRNEVDPHASFLALLSKVRRSTLQAITHQSYPFDRLIEELDIPRTLQRFPVSPVLFNFLNFNTIDHDDTASCATSHRPLEQEAKFDLGLYLKQQENGILIDCHYRTACFSSGTVESLMQEYMAGMSCIGACPDQVLARFKLFDRCETAAAEDAAHRLSSPFLDFINASLNVPLRHSSVVSLFHAALQIDGNHPAITYEDQIIRYQQLDQDSNRVANSLIEYGAAQGTVVATLLDNPVAQITATLGILKAGCIFAALNSSHPRQRLLDAIEVAAPQWIVSETACTALLGQLTCPDLCKPRVLLLDQPAFAFSGADGYQSHAIRERAIGRPQIDIPPDASCYLYFTSGSTGKPKAVLGRMRGLAHFIQWEIEAFGLDRQTRGSQFTPATFDVYLRDIFAPLCSGGTVCIPVLRDILEPDALADWIDHAGVTLIHCVPSLFRVLLDSHLTPSRFPSLKSILLAGEALRPVDVNKWNAVFGSRIELVNLYGPTETTLAKFFYRIPDAVIQDAFVPIGKPIPGAQAILLDRKLDPCPQGQVGEIHIRTPYRSSGYYRQPDLTQAVFIENPFSGDPADLLYKTGDFGIVLPDGNFRFMGRQDLQVKIRGMRVELGEIEAMLCTYPSVREAVVAAYETDPEDQRLAAYVVTDGSTIDDAALHTFLLQALPEHMVPSAFVCLDRLPLTPNGKIDRQALPVPDTGNHGTSNRVAPRNPVEAGLSRIWADTLKIEEVGIHDNFFLLGGHSLLATQAVSRARQQFEMNIPLRTLFEHPTIAGFAREIAAARQSGRQAPPPILPVGRETSVPLSFAQERLWFLHQLEPQSAAYNIPIAVQIKGALNHTALQNALHALAERHESLRTAFPSIDGVPVQHIAPAPSIPVVVQDLTDIDLSERKAAALHMVEQEASIPFDLSEGPLLRALLLRLEVDDHIALLTMHHIVSDGWSSAIINRELFELYDAFTRNLPDRLEPLPIQYADFAVWQRNYLQGEMLERQLEYWTNRLAQAPTLLQLPTDRARPAIQTYQGRTVPIHLEKALSDRFDALARSAGATLFMGLLGVFNILLWRYSGQTDLVVGSPIANRHHAALEPLIGFFVNTLALRSRLNPQASFRSLLAEMRETTLSAYEHQDLPFERLVDALRIPRSVSHSPLFQVMFVLQNAPGNTGTDIGDLEVNVLSDVNHVSMFDLTLLLTESPDGLAGHWEYNVDLFDASTIERMNLHFCALIEQIVRDPDQALQDLNVLTRQERQRILYEWNGTAADYPRGQDIHQLFEAQAERTPDAIAVVFGNTQLTYAQLNTKANQLAHHLHTLGMGPDVLAALCVERGIEMVIGLIGILKAGGLYVPLDPAHPKERLAYMLEDARPAVLLTQAALADLLPRQDIPTFLLDADWAKITRKSKKNPMPSARPEHLAYVIYTSGSTGKPKGVMIERGAAVNFLHAMSASPGMTQHDCLLAVTTVAFDIAGLEIYLPLMHGAKVVLASREHAADAAWLMQAIEQQAVTAMQATPATWRLLLESGWPGKPGLKVMCGGEALTADLAKDLLKRADTVWNLYGPTETTVWSAAQQVDETDTQTHAAIPIGRPIGNTSIYILDANGCPVPPGVAGEIWIGGAGVARGYLNRPELTAERFMPDPFSRTSGARLYKTGDLGRWHPEGRIAYVGRNDFQVKIRGFRIELGEIEAALNQLPEVIEAVVQAIDDSTGGKGLAAYVVAQQDTTAAALRLALQGRLPDYMIPAQVVFLENMPLNTNGKVDRKALPVPGAMQAAFAAPRTLTEKAVAPIWFQVLGLTSAGVHDNFFDLGGHSFRAILLFAAIKRTFGVTLPISSIFSHPTIAAQSSLIDSHYQITGSLVVPLAVAPTRPALFCIHAAGGHVLYYRHLARRLGTQFSVHGVQSPQMAGMAQQPDSVRGAALLYAQAIKTVQPQGPYRLLGWSAGGLLAMAVAAALEKQGDQVEYVGLLDVNFDPAAPDEIQVRAALAAFNMMNGGLTMQDTATIRSIMKEKGIERLIDGDDAALDALLPYLEQTSDTAGKVAVFRQQLAHIRHDFKLLTDFKPEKIRAPLCLVWADGSHNMQAARQIDWRKLTADVDRINSSTINADHYTMLQEPNVAQVAQAILALKGANHENRLLQS